MEEYNLEPGEFLILESQDARIKLASGDALDKIALTNRSLILVKTQTRGLFDKARMLKRCPLSKIERTYDEAQINLTKRGTKYMLNIPFSDECISLLFDDGQGTIARNWAESIRKAANGDLNSIREEEATPLEQIKGSFLEAFGNIGPKEKHRASLQSPSSWRTYAKDAMRPSKVKLAILQRAIGAEQRRL